MSDPTGFGERDAWVADLRKRLTDAIEYDLPRPLAMHYSPHERAFLAGYADCHRLFHHVIDALPAARARVNQLEEAIVAAEGAILGDGTIEADVRLHESLRPLWNALHRTPPPGAQEATDGR